MNNLKMLKKAMLAYVSAVKFVWSEIAYPLSIVGKKLMNLRGYKVYGNSVQDGTPTPDSPVEIQSVGDLSTKNLLSIKDIYTTPYTGEFGVTISQIDDYTLEINGEFTGSANMSVGTRPLIVPIKVDTTKRYSITCKYISGITSNPNNVYNYVFFGQANDVSGDGNSNWTPITMDNKDTVRTNISIAKNYIYSIRIALGVGVSYENYRFQLQIEEGTTATEYEPYHKYKIPVVARGKNLLPTPTFSTFTQNGVTFTNNKDGSITINGTPTAYTATPNMYLPNSTLEVLRNNVCVLTGFHYYEKNIALVLAIGLNGNWIKYIYLNPYTYQNYVKVDLTNVEFDTVVFAVRVQNNDILIDNLTIKPLLEVGTTMPKAFEPYIAPVTTNIFLDEPLRKVGNYADYVDFEKQKVMRNVEVLDDTGTKTIDESLGVINPPTEETVNLPAIPQFKGTTIYEVGTSIKPSGMEAKYC